MSRIVVGAGGYTYEVLWPFRTIPSGMKLGSVSHVAVDSRDRVYLYQRKNPPILVFDAEGEMIDSWGDDLLVDGHGIYVTGDDKIFAVARGVHEVIKFNVEGEIILRIGNRERPLWGAPFNHPTDIAVSPSGEIYVSDGYGNARVHKFSPKGELLLSWGSPGRKPGEFHTPHGIWVDNEEMVYVADRDNNRVQIFNAEGIYLTSWTDFFHPMDIFMDSNGAFYVTDQTPRLTVLNSEGELLSRGFAPDVGHGIWGNSRGDLYLAGLEKGVAKLAKLQYE